MRIPVNELSHHLKRGLLPFYFIYGEEPLQRREVIDLLRLLAKTEGLEVQEIFDLSSSSEEMRLWQSLNTFSLFSSKRLMVCYLKEGSFTKNSQELMQKITTFISPEQVLLLIYTGKIDAKLKKAPWFTRFEQQYTTVPTLPLTKDKLSHWIQDRARALKLTLSPDMIHTLILYTEGNLLATGQALEKLALLEEPSQESLKSLLNQEAVYSVFELVDTLLQGDKHRTSSILTSLKREGIEPLLILWALAKEVRILVLIKECQTPNNLDKLMDLHQIWKAKKPWVLNTLQKHNLSSLYNILTLIQRTDFLIKTEKKDAVWQDLLIICLKIMEVAHAP